ncbi:hypothetical protein ACFV5J_38420 [Streptomyces zaomyceticus]|uniref:hypothetical protein n=1 Tax=Streptomyces zaomyceticus TaxID=68286 RepID=UPI00366A112A
MDDGPWQLAARSLEHAQRSQRDFLTANGVPLAAGVYLSTFTDVPATPVYGQVTLGLLWGLLQCGLLVATAWRYETRSTRECDPHEESLLSRRPGAATTFDAFSADSPSAVRR